MKPDWKDAPEWANYLAMDADGCWFWFEYEPHCCEGEWFMDDPKDRIADAGREEGFPRLEQRP